jgi:hypothetical protein
MSSSSSSNSKQKGVRGGDGIGSKNGAARGRPDGDILKSIDGIVNRVLNEENNGRQPNGDHTNGEHHRMKKSGTWKGLDVLPNVGPFSSLSAEPPPALGSFPGTGMGMVTEVPFNASMSIPMQPYECSEAGLEFLELVAEEAISYLPEEYRAYTEAIQYSDVYRAYNDMTQNNDPYLVYAESVKDNLASELVSSMYPASGSGLPGQHPGGIDEKPLQEWNNLPGGGSGPGVGASPSVSANMVVNIPEVSSMPSSSSSSSSSFSSSSSSSSSSAPAAEQPTMETVQGSESGLASAFPEQSLPPPAMLPPPISGLSAATSSGSGAGSGSGLLSLSQDEQFPVLAAQEPIAVCPPSSSLLSSSSSSSSSSIICQVASTSSSPVQTTATTLPSSSTSSSSSDSDTHCSVSDDNTTAAAAVVTTKLRPEPEPEPSLSDSTDASIGDTASVGELSGATGKRKRENQADDRSL